MSLDVLAWFQTHCKTRECWKYKHVSHKLHNIISWEKFISKMRNMKNAFNFRWYIFLNYSSLLIIVELQLLKIKKIIKFSWTCSSQYLKCGFCWKFSFVRLFYLLWVLYHSSYWVPGLFDQYHFSTTFIKILNFGTTWKIICNSKYAQ